MTAPAMTTDLAVMGHLALVSDHALENARAAVTSLAQETNCATGIGRSATMAHLALATAPSVTTAAPLGIGHSATTALAMRTDHAGMIVHQWGTGRAVMTGRHVTKASAVSRSALSLLRHGATISRSDRGGLVL
jgi:hypothetical protein